MNTKAKTVLFGLVAVGCWCQQSGRATAGPTSLVPILAVGQSTTEDSRRESDKLLRQTRAAIKDGNLEVAERYLARAEQLDVSYDGLFQRFLDSPDKARKDLERLKQYRDRGSSRRLPSLFGKKTGDQKPSPSDPFSGPPEDSDAVTQDDSSGPAQPRRLPSETQQIATPLAPAGIVSNPFVRDPDYPATGQPGLTSSVAGRPQLGALPGNVPSDGRAEALRLLAQSAAALDRGDLATAHNLAEKAQQLGVADGAFAGGDTPWSMLMRINKEQQRRGGIAETSLGTEEPLPGKQSRVQQAIYDPTQDSTYVRQASAEESLSAPDTLIAQESGAPSILRQPSPFPDLPDNPSPETTIGPPPTPNSPAAESDGVPASPAVSAAGASPVQLIEMGEQALRDRRLEEARKLFRQAWVHEGQLDAQTRQRLQDHLQLAGVQPSAAPANRDDAESDEQARARRLLAEVSREQTLATRQLTSQPKVAWERLKALRVKVTAAEVGETVQKPLLARIDRAIEETERFIDRNRVQIEQDEHNRDVLAMIARERKLRVEIDEKLVSMVDEFNELMDQQRYAEAYVLAKQARDLDADNEVVQNMVWKSRFAERLLVEMSLQGGHRTGFESALESVNRSGQPFNDANPIEYPDAKAWKLMTGQRQRLMGDANRRMTEEELQIQRALRKKVQVQFSERPLSEVLNTLAGMADVNVFLDPQGLAVEGITTDTPVSINLTQEISLKSALNLILQPLRLSYVIQDEVLRITTEQARAGDVYQQVYYVADLVTPIPNFLPSYNVGIAGALQQAQASLGYGLVNGAAGGAPLAVLAENNEQLGPQASVLAQMNASGLLPNNAGSTQPVALGPGGLGRGSRPDFDMLIDLITSTVAPTSWAEVGGPGAVASFDGNLSLVVSNTQEVHEEIVDLLEQLRRLQDLQVTIEVRFITLSDDFFERIGVDFDFEIRDKTGLTPADITAGNDADDRLDVTIGIDPATGQPTADLDLVFNQNNFAGTAPIFGGFDPAAASTFGFAILSDIQAFFVIEAVQGDSRTNILQAPKVTLFNGQFATINDTSQRPFVTSVIPVVGDFAAAHQPVIVVLAEGTQLSVQAVVSNDRRFVRLTLVPFFSQIGDVDTFTFNGRRTTSSGTVKEDPTDDTMNVTDDEETSFEGTTVQLPTFNSTSVSTTVSVPDGGTILLGGIKSLAEGRTERGLPILSKLPYVSRLFKNVGIGRETESLMLMVTPRIIIQEEEEERLLGTPVQ